MALSLSEERPKKARMEPPWKLKVLMVDGAPVWPIRIGSPVSDKFKRGDKFAIAGAVDSDQALVFTNVNLHKIRMQVDHKIYK